MPVKQYALNKASKIGNLPYLFIYFNSGSALKMIYNIYSRHPYKFLNLLQRPVTSKYVGEH